MNKNDGGPAYPYIIETSHAPSGAPISTNIFPGMSLRDWFAGMALSGMLSAPNLKISGSNQVNEQSFALASYLVADAMLLERSK